MSFYPRNPLTDDAVFSRKLRTVAERIKTSANGRTCGNCRSYMDGRCNEHLNLEGRPLVILYDTAPACGSYEQTVVNPRSVASLASVTAK